LKPQRLQGEKNWDNASKSLGLQRWTSDIAWGCNLTACITVQNRKGIAWRRRNESQIPVQMCFGLGSSQEH